MGELIGGTAWAIAGLVFGIMQISKLRKAKRFKPKREWVGLDCKRIEG